MIKSRILYALLLLGGLFFFILYQENLSIVILFLLVVVPMLLFLPALRLKQKLQISLQASHTVAGKGEPVSFQLIVKNPSFCSVSNAQITLVCTNGFNSEVQRQVVVIPVLSRNTQQVDCGIASQYCGLLGVQVESIKLYDCFQIYSVTASFSDPVQISVMPNICIPELTISSNYASSLLDSNVYSKHKSGDDPSEIFKIRDYIDGDKPNRIHWKLSNKQGTLMVKEFGLPVTCSVLILLELYLPGEGKNNPILQIEALVETLCALSLSLLEHEIAHRVLWYHAGRKVYHITEVGSQEDYFVLLGEVLSSCPAVPEMTALEYFETHSTVQEYSRLLYLLPEWKEDTLSAFQQGQNREKRTLFYMDDTASESTGGISGDTIELVAVRPGKIEQSLDGMMI